MGLNTKRICWDSNCFLAILNNEPNRAGVCKAIIDMAKSNTIELYASVLVTCEVAKPNDPHVDIEKFEAMIQGLFMQPYIKVVALEPVISKIARDIIRDRELSREQYKDAIHLATAVFLKVDVFHTYDNWLLKTSRLKYGNLKISEPTDFQLTMLDEAL